MAEQNAETSRNRSRSRDRIQTDRGRVYQIEVVVKNFQKCISNWRKHAVELERVIGLSQDAKSVIAALDDLDASMLKTREVYQRMVDLLSDDEINEYYQKFDTLEADHVSLTRLGLGHIREIEVDNFDAGSRVARSHKSRTSSRSSKASDKRIEAATQAAALRAKLKYLDKESQQKAELEKLQMLKEIDVAEATLEAISKIEREDGELSSSMARLSLPHMDPVERFLSENELPVSNLNQAVTDIEPTPFNFNKPATVNTTKPVCNAPESILNPWCDMFIPNTSQSKHGDLPPEQLQSPVLNVLSSLTEQISLCRLPPPEPAIFTGDPLQYPGWRCAFHTLIEGHGIPAEQKLHYLKRYLGGAAKEAVEGYLLLTSSDAFDQAKAVLEKRYGDSFVVAGAFRDKLDAWPKIQNHDGISLRKYSDYLRQCVAATDTTPSLNVLNDDRENHKMLTKLPDWLITRWSRIVSTWREDHHKFPSFKTFVAFVEKEAQITCDPITSLQALSRNHIRSNRDRFLRVKPTRSTGATSFATDGASNYSRTSPCNRLKPAAVQKLCLFCEKRYHGLDDCFAFGKKPIDDRIQFLMKRGLCFGCYEHGHRINRWKN